MICKWCPVTTSDGPKPAHLKPKVCPICNLTKAAYIKIGKGAEYEQMHFYRTVWLKAKNFNQKSTGSPTIDKLIVSLWGRPTSKFLEVQSEQNS